MGVRLKWPNDVLVDGRKLAGILVETRWREGQVDWVAVGIGINVGMSDEPNATGLRVGTRRLDVLAELMPALRAAARARGPLSPKELERWAALDVAAGRRCRSPVPGVVRGLASDGSLIVERDGQTALARAGSLVPRRSRDHRFDVGNTETTIGVFDGEELRAHWRITTGVGARRMSTVCL